MTKIETPEIKVRNREKDWRRKIVKLLGGGFGAEKSYHFNVGEEYYYPYWIGKVFTSKNRLILSPKVIYFYVVCDAIDRTFVVLRNLPKTRCQTVDSGMLIPLSLQKGEFEKEIIKQAVVDCINKQFIVGVPDVEYQESHLIYIPTKEVVTKLTLEAMAKERSGSQTNRFFVNIFTGQPKIVPNQCLPKTLKH